MRAVDADGDIERRLPVQLSRFAPVEDGPRLALQHHRLAKGAAVSEGHTLAVYARPHVHRVAGLGAAQGLLNAT